MKKSILLITILIICISTIILNLTAIQPFDSTSYFISLIILSGSVTYIGIFFTYLVLVWGYKSLKKIFYDDVLFITRNAIEGHIKFLPDFIRTVVFTMTVNFFVLYFMAISPISEIISKIPGMDMTTQVLKLDYTIFSLDTLNQFGNIASLPFSSFGIIILFVLRCLHRKTPNSSQGNYPGSRAILGFCYALLVILLINVIVTNEEVGHDEIKMQESEFSQSTGLAVLFSLLSIFSVIIFVVVDRYIIQKMVSSKYRF